MSPRRRSGSASTTGSLVDICHRLYAKGFVTATDGNVSARLRSGNILTTRSGVNKGAVTTRDLVEVTAGGKPLTIARKPSTEIGMHLEIYRQRPDVRAVVHAHPPFATGFAVARKSLEGCVLPEVVVGLGAIPLAPYATPSTPEVAESLRPFLRTSDAILLASHGVVTYGPTLLDAFYRMEKVEHAAQIIFVARLLGGETQLTKEELAKLAGVSPKSYGKDIEHTLKAFGLL